MKQSTFIVCLQIHEEGEESSVASVLVKDQVSSITFELEKT